MSEMPVLGYSCGMNLALQSFGQDSGCNRFRCHITGLLATINSHVGRQMKTCNKCGGAESYADGRCKVCRREQGRKRNQSLSADQREHRRIIQAEWRKNNADYSREYLRKWKSENKDKVLIYRKRLIEKRGDALLQYWKQYYRANKNKWKQWKAKNPEKKKLSDKKYRESHRDQKRQVWMAWYRKNPESVKRSHHKRRALALANGGVLSKGICGKLMALQKGKCAACRKSLKLGCHLDHIVALSKGGKNIDINIQLLCPSCNSSKNNKDPIDFMQSRGFLL
jgi:5-methylcytosine-specific restriction endonuclease McrA